MEHDPQKNKSTVSCGDSVGAIDHCPGQKGIQSIVKVPSSCIFEVPVHSYPHRAVKDPVICGILFKAKSEAERIGLFYPKSVDYFKTVGLFIEQTNEFGCIKPDLMLAYDSG